MTYEMSVRIDESYDVSEIVEAANAYLAIQSTRKRLKEIHKHSKIWIFNMRII